MYITTMPITNFCKQTIIGPKLFVGRILRDLKNLHTQIVLSRKMGDESLARQKATQKIKIV